MIPDLIRKKLGKRELILKNITIARESIDARDKTISAKSTQWISIQTSSSTSLRHLTYHMIMSTRRENTNVLSSQALVPVVFLLHLLWRAPG